MTVERFNPEGLYQQINVGREEPQSLEEIGYSHITRASGDTHIHVAGLCAVDREGDLVGPGDLAAQTEAIAEHIDTALGAADAELTDAVNVNVYALDPEAFVAEGMPVLTELFGRETLPAITVVGVTALAKPDYLVEIEVEAITD